MKHRGHCFAFDLLIEKLARLDAAKNEMLQVN